MPFQMTMSDVLRYLNDPLNRNSAYLALGRFVDVGAGFLFWIIAARLYSISDVGIATALISSLEIVMAFSRLGFDTTIVRFMPLYNHSRLFNSCLWITSCAALIGGAVFLVIIGPLSPDIAFIQKYAGSFLLIVIVNAITLTTGNALLTFRRADQKFIQNLIIGGRPFFLIPFASLGTLGIFYSYGLVLTLGAIYALLVIRRHISISLNIDKKIIRETFQFTSFNYLASLLEFLPTEILPLLIVVLLSPKDAALYYVAFAIGNLVLIIPNAISTSFFIEGSHGMNLRKGILHSLKTTYIILFPAVILLLFFGAEYCTAIDLLRIIALSSLLVTIYNLYIPYQNIILRFRGIVVINFIRCALIIGLSLLLIPRSGIIGVGFAWAITNLFLGIGIIVMLKDSIRMKEQTDTN